MQPSFQHIMTFSCQHQYFKDGLFKAIYYSCPESTSKLLKDLGIVIKYFSGGFHLLSSNPELLATEIRSNPLQFYLNCKDPYFINYSDLSKFSPSEDLFYFNNLDSSFNDVGKTFDLQIEDFTEEKDIVKLSHGAFKIPSYAEGKSYKYKDASNEEISENLILSNTDEPDTVLVNNLPQGLIRVFQDDEFVQSIYHFHSSVWNKPLGAVEIFSGALYDHFKKHGKVNYSVNFKNRETIWNYYLIDFPFFNYEDLKIINKNKEVVFKPPEKKVIQGNSKGLLFQSKEKIPLLEYTDDHFQLVENFDEALGYGKVVVKILPRASTDFIYQENIDVNDSSEPETFYSHIYL
ncbi:hypothetical protein [Pareuzebyella sediminis]|uniref:hypothetical protein n=1 Tax=Pareuzebyella sediminis TaxID=2607998 RepID=UPI0018E1AFE1|nr:hypothetical protein [Pareuzebyella sediminis]